MAHKTGISTRLSVALHRVMRGQESACLDNQLSCVHQRAFMPRLLSGASPWMGATWLRRTRLDSIKNLFHQKLSFQGEDQGEEVSSKLGSEIFISLVTRCLSHYHNLAYWLARDYTWLVCTWATLYLELSDLRPGEPQTDCRGYQKPRKESQVLLSILALKVSVAYRYVVQHSTIRRRTVG